MTREAKYGSKILAKIGAISTPHHSTTLKTKSDDIYHYYLSFRNDASTDTALSSISLILPTTTTLNNQDSPVSVQHSD